MAEVIHIVRSDVDEARLIARKCLARNAADHNIVGAWADLSEELRAGRSLERYRELMDVIEREWFAALSRGGGS